MAKFVPITVRLKSGEELVIREAAPEDAAALLDFVDQVSRESDYLTFGPGEFGITLEREQEFLETVRHKPNAIFLIGLLGHEVVASLSFAGGGRPRIAHVGEFGMSVRKAYWEMGIGTAMLKAFLDWARQTGVIRKVNLRVRVDNPRAIALYEKCGFRVEGRISRKMQVNGKFYDTLLMGKAID